MKMGFARRMMMPPLISLARLRACATSANLGEVAADALDTQQAKAAAAAVDTQQSKDSSNGAFAGECTSVLNKLNGPDDVTACAGNMSSLVAFYAKNKVAKERYGSLFSHHPDLLEVTQEKLDRLMDLLKDVLDVDDAGIASIIQKNPTIVLHDIEAVRRTVDYCRGLGLENVSLAELFVKEPSLLTVSLERDLQPKVEYLKEHAKISGQAIRKLFWKWPLITSYNFEQQLKPQVDFLLKHGVEGRKLEAVLFKYPWILLQNLEEFFTKCGLHEKSLTKLLSWQPRGVLASVESMSQKEEFLLRAGFVKGTTPFAAALAFAATQDLDVLKSRAARFLQYGISEADAYSMYRKNPGLLIVRDSQIHRKAQYILEVMKVPVQELVETPILLTFSLEKRLKPRCELRDFMLSRGFFKRPYAWKTLLGLPEEMLLSRIAKHHPDAPAFYAAFRDGDLEQQNLIRSRHGEEGKEGANSAEAL